MSEERRLGVYYPLEDYITLPRRLLIDLIDGPVVVLVSAAALVLLRLSAPTAAESRDVVLPLLACIWVGYFVILKRSRLRTPGYRVAGARITNLKGEAPSIGSLVARLLFALGGPLNLLIDVSWIAGDPNRQALRDKFAATYVVRLRAQPAGTGAIVRRTYTVWGATFLFQEVTRDRAPSSPTVASLM
jgi:uncharacterized RDD family membrane protein YckC